ncbi:MAG: hypothetical protein MI741_09600, partial [Rhodospirillales bacterium]|nr:hypothetical protein [Rhodospirillales bacterium]
MSRRTPQSETKRPTRDEYELRVELVATLISKGKRDGQIKRMMRKQFDVSPRTVQSYLARAREQLRARRNRSREDLQAESLAFYESVIADDKASNYEKLMAARRRDLLL